MFNTKIGDLVKITFATGIAITSLVQGIEEYGQIIKIASSYQGVILVVDMAE